MHVASKQKILFVDDDAHILDAMRRNLRKRFQFDTALGPDEALRMLKINGPYAVVVADMSMPVMTGAELLEVIRTHSPDTVRIMLTGNSDQNTATEAVNRGNVFRFLTKPCPPETLSAMLDTALKQHELIVTEKALLNQTLKGTLQVLTDILAMLDADVFGQAQLRRALAREVALKTGIGSPWDIEIAALLAEIGLITLPATVRDKLRAQQTLTVNERHLFERMPEFSSHLLASIPRLESVAQAVLYQNKNFDGSGFPVDNISRSEIPIGARILRVAHDVVRMHNKGLALVDIVSSLKAGPERYDPNIVKEVATCGAVLKSTPNPANANKRTLTIAELVPGCVLLSDITTTDGNVVLCAGTTINSTQLQRLRNLALLHPIREPIAADLPPGIKQNGRASLDQIALP